VTGVSDSVKTGMTGKYEHFVNKSSRVVADQETQRYA
jgi:hypothetical protein